MRLSPAFVFVAALALAGSALAQSIVVKGVEGRMETVTAADLRAMRQASVTVPYGDKATYSGAVIGDVLAEVGAPSEKRLHGAPVNQIIVVTGSDGFTTVLALAEAEPSFRREPVILADRKNGQPLSAKEGPYRLVIGGELEPARSVYAVIEIELRPVNTNQPVLPAHGGPLPAQPH
jgi:hypothetical protein